MNISSFSPRRFVRTKLLLSLCFPLASGAFLATTPSAAVAATSQLTGIIIPKNGEPFPDVSSNFTALFDQLGNDSAVKLKPAGEAEAFVWRGDNYEEKRIPFMKTMLASALTSKGYEVKDILDRDLHHVSIFECFDMGDTSLPFHQNMWKGHFYMQATNESTGKAVLIAWLEGDDSVALGMIPVDFKAKPHYSLPTTGANVVLVKDGADATKGLGLVHVPTFSPITRKHNMLRGWLKDGSGHPIAGGEVIVDSSAGGGFRTSHKGRSNAQGLYEVLVPTGVCQVSEARATVNYNGASYTLRMLPATGHTTQFFAQDGGIENFVLTSGGAMGGTVRIQNGFRMGIIQATLVPQGLMADGSKGRTFVFRYNAQDTSGDKYLNGLPLGRYKLTAQVLDEGDALPLRVAMTFGSDEERTPGSDVQVDFEPGYSYSMSREAHINPEIKMFDITVQP